MHLRDSLPRIFIISGWILQQLAKRSVRPADIMVLDSEVEAGLASHLHGWLASSESGSSRFRFLLAAASHPFLVSNSPPSSLQILSSGQMQAGEMALVFAGAPSLFL